MYKHILVATDGSELAEKAASEALALARALDSKVTVVTVTDIYPTGVYSPIPMPSVIERYEVAAAENARKILASASATARKLGVICETRHIKDQMPAEGIVAAAGEAGCDLITMASHGRRGAARMLLGSQAQKVITLSPVSVLIYR